MLIDFFPKKYKEIFVFCFFVLWFLLKPQEPHKKKQGLQFLFLGISASLQVHLAAQSQRALAEDVFQKIEDLEQAGDSITITTALFRGWDLKLGRSLRETL